MKKRILSALLAIMICMSSIGVMAKSGDLILSDTTKLSMENTDACFAKATNEEYHADSNYYMHFASSGDWLEVTQNLTEGIVAGGQYVITVVAKPVSGRIWFRIGWDDTGWLMSEQTDLATDLGDGWYRYVKEITLTANQTSFLFHNDGAAEMYIDSISLKPAGEDKELLPNSGFDAVTYDEQTGVILANNTTVNVANTDAVYAKIVREEIPAENEYSLHFKTGAGDWFEVTQNLTETATSGSQYVFTAYIKPVTGTVWFRLGWDDTAWMISTQDGTTGPDGWKKIEKVVTMTADQTNLLFHNDGATEIYIDDISLVAVGGTENLIPDGGFSEVTVEGFVPEVGIPDEDLILSDKTTVNVTNTDTVFAKVTDNEKYAGDYSLHFKAPASAWLEVSQRLNQNTATGEKYIISANVKAVSGRVWFRLGWDDTAWMVADSDDLGTEWTYIEKEVTIAGNDNGGELNTILFHNDQGEGDAEFYIDNLSVVKVGEETELVPDGGFEDVTVAGEEPPHEHVYAEEITTPATCGADGVKIFTCECNDSYTEVIPATGEHVWDEGVITTEPQIGVEGVKTYTCTGCPETKTEVIPPLTAPIEPAVITIGGVEAQPGDEIAVPVSIEKNPGVVGFILDVTFDTSVLTYVGATQGEALPELTLTTPGNLNVQPLVFLWDGLDADSSNGEFVTLTFKVSDDATDGEYEVGASIRSVYDQDLNDVNVAVVNGTVKVEVKELMYGDVNNDGKVEIKDVVLLRQYMTGGYGAVINEEAADVNHDGTVTVNDLVLIRRYIVGGYGVQF